MNREWNKANSAWLKISCNLLAVFGIVLTLTDVIYAGGCAKETVQPRVIQQTSIPVVLGTADMPLVGFPFQHLPIPTTIAIEGRKLYFVSPTGDVIAFDGEHRRIIWQRHHAANLNQTYVAVMHGRMYFVGNNDQLVCAESATGRIIWQSSPISGVAIYALKNLDNAIYVSGPGGIARLDARTGRIVWKNQGFLLVNVRAMSNRFVVADTAGGSPVTTDVAVFDARSGKFSSIQVQLNTSGDARVVAVSDRAALVAVTPDFGIIGLDKIDVRTIEISLTGGDFSKPRLYKAEPNCYSADTQDPSAIVAAPAVLVFTLNSAASDTAYFYQGTRASPVERPIALRNIGFPLTTSQHAIVFHDDWGLKSFTLTNDTMYERRLVTLANKRHVDRNTFNYSNTYALTENLIVLSSGDGNIYVVDPVHQKARAYPVQGVCSSLLGAWESGTRVAIFCAHDGSRGEVLTATF